MPVSKSSAMFDLHELGASKLGSVLWATPYGSLPSGIVYLESGEVHQKGVGSPFGLLPGQFVTLVSPTQLLNQPL